MHDISAKEAKAIETLAEAYGYYYTEIKEISVSPTGFPMHSVYLNGGTYTLLKDAMLALHNLVSNRNPLPLN